MALLCLSNLKKTWYYLQKNGIRSACLAAQERILESRQAPYVYVPVEEKLLEEQRAERVSEVRFSVVVPAYETKEAHLYALLDSMAAQTWPYWELVVADASESDAVETVLWAWARAHHISCVSGTSPRDAMREAAKHQKQRSIRYLRLPGNEGIAQNTNAGIACATGEYIGLLDHDDLLTSDALYEFAKKLKEENEAGKAPQVLYSDEDKCDSGAGTFFEPHRKPDFNLDLLLSNNYICHFLVVESGLMKKLMLRRGFDGAQDYDLVLRAAAGGARFAHIPRVLYHWRCHDASTAANPRSKAYAYEAGALALEDFVRNAGWEAAVLPLKHLGFYRIEYGTDVFAQRPGVGALAGPLPDRRRLVSGIYDADGKMLFEGLKKGFSGPMHRAALQQDVFSADLRAMRVREELKAPYAAARARIANAGEAEIRRESIAFCEHLKKEGYLILWDPQVVWRKKS